MFGGGSSGYTPPPALPDPLPSAPSYASGAGAKPAGKAGQIPAYGGTLMTSPMGADTTGTNVQRKSLLGQ